MELESLEVTFAEPFKLFLHIDNNAWDVFAQQQIDLDNELPRDQFRLLMTREAQFELEGMPPAKRQYVDRLISAGPIQTLRVQTDIYFGFYVEGIPPREQRVAGFGDVASPGVGGRFIEGARGRTARTRK
jgi:hypothetical protein